LLGDDLNVADILVVEKEWSLTNPKAPKRTVAAPAEQQQVPQFPAARLQRVGAGTKQAQQARARFDAMGPIEQEASAAQLAAMSDAELRAEITEWAADENRPDFDEATVVEVMEWVGDSEVRADEALAAEQAGRGRKSLIAKLGG